MPYWDLARFHDRVLRHKVLWDENPFLLCRTVTPLSVREKRLFCNCPECYKSRRMADRYCMSHPFGSFVDPPCDKNTFSWELREADIKQCFSYKDAQIILAMIQTDPEAKYKHSSSPLLWPPRVVKQHVEFLINEWPIEYGVSLLGTKYERLRTYFRSKGPNMLKRALRSHSLSPFGRTSLYTIREKTDSIVLCDTKRYRYNPRYDDKFRICFRNIPGTVEYLILHGCFYRGHNKPVFSGLDLPKMSGPAPKRSKTNSPARLLVCVT